MSFFRLLFLILLVWWLARALRSWKIQVIRREPPPQQGEPEVLRACSRCGVLVPARTLDAAGRCAQCRSTT